MSQVNKSIMDQTSTPFTYHGHIVPEQLTLWDWLFDSQTSPLYQQLQSNIGGFTNAVTKERVRYDEVKDYATFISTALVQKFGFTAGDAVALFSPNTVWYPVAMFATTRIGMCTLEVTCDVSGGF